MISNDISIPIARFRYYSFRANSINLLPQGVELVIDRSCGYSMLLAWNRMNDQVITACKFTLDELSAVLLLCENWPSMVTHELLLTALRPAPEVPIVTYQVEDARTAGILEQLIAPLKHQLENDRSRLQELGLDLREVEGYGYRLVALTRPTTEVMRKC